jgi:hypothetical protein
MLDLIEIALRKDSFVFQRIDGQTSLERRIRALDAFKTEHTCTVMLASIGSIGEGYDQAFLLTWHSHSMLTSLSNYLASIS